MELMSSIKEAEEKTVYELSNIADIIGKNDYSLAIDYTKVTTPIENIIICGEVTTIQRKSYKRKSTKTDEEFERAFYNFSIKNDGKVMYCSIFPRQHDETKGDLIEVGTAQELISKVNAKNFEDAFVSIATGGRL